MTALPAFFNSILRNSVFRGGDGWNLPECRLPEPQHRFAEICMLARHIENNSVSDRIPQPEGFYHNLTLNRIHQPRHQKNSIVPLTERQIIGGNRIRQIEVNPLQDTASRQTAVNHHVLRITVRMNAQGIKGGFRIFFQIRLDRSDCFND